MANVRYVRNTSGEYTAFVISGHLFAPGCEWLGVLQGMELFDTEGEHVGTLWPDDRLIRNRTGGQRRSILKPRWPIRPVRPLPPKRGLFLSAVAPPYEDVFEALVRPLTALATVARLQRMYSYEGTSLVAADGTFLGLISRHRSHEESLGNLAGVYGNPNSEVSIFNERGVYGGADSELSPFSATAKFPPIISRDGDQLGCLSRHSDIADRVDPNALVAWLAMR
jgi:hypothetical protein